MLQLSGKILANCCPQLALIVLLCLAVQTKADCNACSPSQKACVSHTGYKICDNGIPFGDTYECPPDKKCSLAAECEAVEAPLLGCDECKICDLTNTFACTGIRSFALCLGTDIYSDVVTGTCLDGTVCSINYPYICGSDYDAVDITSSCSQTDEPPTTPSPSSNPQQFCQALNTQGRFPVGNDRTTTCKQYIRCIKTDTDWYGAVYWCPGDTYFDGSKQLCGATVPNRCGSESARMVLLNLF